MTPAEVMISESQERMLAIVRPGLVADVERVCRRWGINATVIGRVTDDGTIRIVSGATELARIPAAALTSDAIVYQREARPPVHERAAPAPGVHRELLETEPGLPERGMDPGAVLLALLGHPNLCSRSWLTTQYDETVGADTVEGGEHGAAVLRVRGTPRALVMATDACAGVASLDPYLGAALAVAECTRNVAVTGARPLGVTDCLNYGDPGRPEAFWAFTEAIRGVADACRALELPVTGGNVSFYNESGRGAIAPTAQIGVVGLLDDIDRRVGPVFRSAGDVIGLLGSTTPGLAGSVYASLAGRAWTTGRPAWSWAGSGPCRSCSSRPRRKACWRRPRTSRAGASPSPSPRAASGRAWEPSWIWRSAPRRPWSCSARRPAGWWSPPRPRAGSAWPIWPPGAACRWSVWAASAAAGCTSA